MKILLILAKIIEKQKLNFSCSALFHMKTRVSLKYFVNDCTSLFHHDHRPAEVGTFSDDTCSLTTVFVLLHIQHR